jgi:nucleotide-binding universal stress UspA family protein
MFSRIVVGTDGSDTANAAVALAVELARQSGATVHLVSAYKDPSTSVAVAHAGVAAVPDPSLTDAARASCEELLTETTKHIDGITVQSHVVCGPAADMIVQVARGVDADLIIVGSKGMKGARRLIGSVPNSVAHGAPCHVLIAKTA